MDLNGKPGWKTNRGVAVLELAFTLIFLLLLTIGITEIGRGFWYYSALQTAVRNGARCLSNEKWNPSATISECQTLVRDDANSAGIWPLLTTANVTLSCDGATCTGWGSGTAPEYVSVQVLYNMNWLWSITETTPQAGGTTGLKVVATMPYMAE
jgi:Flp pilus assembly protein TadG